jgi:hypothetical protein
VGANIKRNKMKNQKEIMEALLRGETLIYKDKHLGNMEVILNKKRGNLVIKHDESFVISDVFFALFSVPYHWETKKKTVTKRFWIWNIKEPHYRKTSVYFDESGMDTTGNFYRGWNEYEKQKLEDEFIDVEVEE